MNGQIVLCKGVNDKEELERTISDLAGYLPVLESVSVVPVGLSRYREGLYPLEPFTKEDAREAPRPSIGGRKSCIPCMGCILSMPAMNGISWRKKNCQKRIATTGICSWKTAWECFGFCRMSSGKRWKRRKEIRKESLRVQELFPLLPENWLIPIFFPWQSK